MHDGQAPTDATDTRPLPAPKTGTVVEHFCADEKEGINILVSPALPQQPLNKNVLPFPVNTDIVYRIQVAVAVGVIVGVTVFVGVIVGVTVFVGVIVGVGVILGVIVFVGVIVGVIVGVTVFVGVIVGVGVILGVGVGVLEGV